MQKLLYEIIAKRDEILKIAKECKVENVRIFGSVASGTETKRSDIDFLVDFKESDKDKSGYIRFALALRYLFPKRRIECCTPETLHPRFTDKVLNNNISIMEDNPEFLEKSKRDYIVNIEKSLEWIKHYNSFIQEYTKEDVIENMEIRDSFRSAIQKPLEEMVRFVPLSLRKQIAPDTNWRDIKELRNFIVHHYDNVEWEGMWTMAQESLKDLEKGCKKLLKHLKAKEEKNKK